MRLLLALFHVVCNSTIRYALHNLVIISQVSLWGELKKNSEIIEMLLDTLQPGNLHCPACQCLCVWRPGTG